MFKQISERADLVAPNVKIFMNNTLRGCRNLKDQYIVYFWNIGLASLLLLIFGLFLYYRYKGKPTKQEIEERERQEKNYIMQKLGNHIATRMIEKKIQETNMRNGIDTMITNLPNWNNHPELPILQNKQNTYGFM